MRFCVAIFFSASMVLFVFAGSPANGSVLDQSFQPTINENFNIGAGDAYAAQVVTAGISGYLTEADLDVYRFMEDQTTPWEVTVRAVNSSGAPTGTILATQMLPATAAYYTGDSSPYHELIVDFSNSVFISAGEQFALAVRSPGFADNPDNEIGRAHV